ncbi:MAG: hypothetical protein GC146_09265 [Limimaricola sp.]|uniref:hypothetical protein n=1 Tax=Limimaricola sp. TaxID=2211665 RepID=UPI001DC76168|nr:hypothetical protein [Limimaricola sp.]MBI1417399.1 hypothetical protein [Limimaricola sp.]
MEFMRPEAKAALWRWREVFAASAVVLLGLYWTIIAFGVARLFGAVVAVLGIALAFTAFQRLRFAQSGLGPGIVRVDERRLEYLGPLTGGILDLDDLVAVELEPKARPAPHWILTGPGGQMVAIPVNAAGAEALFDVFAALPGIRTGAMLAALEHTPSARVTVWRAPAHRLQRRLH